MSVSSTGSYLATLYSTPYEAMRHWVLEASPALYAKTLPSTLAPSRIVPYEDLRLPKILQEHLLPPGEELIMRLETALQGKDVAELPTKSFPHECVFYRVGKLLFFKVSSLPRFIFSVVSRSVEQNGTAHHEVRDGNIQRVILNTRLSQVVKERMLDKLAIPLEFLVHIKGKGKELEDDNYYVVSERLDMLDERTSGIAMRTMPEHSAKQYIRQLYTLFLAVGFPYGGNQKFRLTTDGKLAILNYEPLDHVRSAYQMPFAAQLLGYLRDEEIVRGLGAIDHSHNFIHCSVPFPKLFLMDMAKKYKILAHRELFRNKTMRAALRVLSVTAHIWAAYYLYKRCRRWMSYPF